MSRKLSVLHLLILLTGLILLSSCSAPKLANTYVGNKDTKSYLKLPGKWSTKDFYDSNNVYVYTAFFQNNTSELLLGSNKNITGILIRKDLVDGDIYTQLSSVLFKDFDAKVTKKEIYVISSFPYKSDGYEGFKIIYKTNINTLIETEYIQTSLYSKSNKDIKSLILACSTDCFNAEFEIINKVSTTWKVN